MTFIHHNFKTGFVSQTGLPSALGSDFAKYTKKLIVDGLSEPPMLALKEIKDFFNKTMDKLGFTVGAPGTAVVAVFRTLNIDEDVEEGDEEVKKEEEVKEEIKKEEEAGVPGTCVLEFRTVEEATAAVAMDGLTFSGSQLHVARPESYQRAVSDAKQQFIPGGVSTNVVDSPFKVFMGSIPTSLSDEQVMELLKAFGDLKSFNLIKDLQTGEPKV
jgi:hypothetical protein